MKSTYAESTSVPVARSRSQIDNLLRDWGCDGIRWTDHFRKGTVQVEFLWTHDEQEYLARFSIHVDPEDSQRTRQAHRILLVWLKASLNAVNSGIIEAAALFLPFLVGQDGKTVADVCLPRLPDLLGSGAHKLLDPGLAS